MCSKCALKGALKGLITGALGGKLGSAACKLLRNLASKLGLGKFVGRIGSKVLCTGSVMAAGMGIDVGMDAVLGNCFVAGTEVWVLKEGIDPGEANAALAAGADWEELAELKPIEEVETGDYALSRPDDDADGELGFHQVTRLYRNTTAELVEITVYDAEEGFAETITTTPGHPFWVGDQWMFAAEIVAGDALTDADGDTLTVSAAAYQTRHAVTYNFCVDEDHTYYVGITSAWVHNDSVITGDGRDHVTYRGMKIVKINGVRKVLPYTGYASAPSSLGLNPKQIISRRYNGNFEDFLGAEPPKSVYDGSGVDGKRTARGLEQSYYDEDLRAAGGDRDKVANRQRPVGPSNSNRGAYEKAARNHMKGQAKKKGC